MVTAEQILGLKKDVAAIVVANGELSGIIEQLEEVLCGPPNLLTGVCERRPDQWNPSVAEVLVHPLDERSESRKTGW